MQVSYLENIQKERYSHNYKHSCSVVSHYKQLMEVITQSKRTALGIIRIQPLELVYMDSCEQNEKVKLLSLDHADRSKCM